MGGVDSAMSRRAPFRDSLSATEAVVDPRLVALIQAYLDVVAIAAILNFNLAIIIRQCLSGV